MKQQRNTNSIRYTQQITQQFQIQRDQIGQMSKELLLIFADGQVEILKRVAAGLRATVPEDPDLPIIHATIHDMQSSIENGRYSGGPGKGKRAVYSIPVEDVPQHFLVTIQESHYKTRLRRDLTYALREILGSARRANLPEELNWEALTAYCAELDTRELSAKTVTRKILDMQRLGRLFSLDEATQDIISNEFRAAKLVADQEPSNRHIAFRANPLSPLDYARKARDVSKEAFSTKGNRQTIQKLFITAGALSLLSFLPERISDILGAAVGKDVTRDARGWSSQYFSRKSGVDRSFSYLPEQLTPYLDDLILLGAKPGPQGRDFTRLYKFRVSSGSPLFARVNLRDAYSSGRIFELVKERTGHGPHTARKAMTDYLAEIGGTPEDILDLLGHRQISTSEKHYAVYAAAHHRKRTLSTMDKFRDKLVETGEFRLPSGRLIDLDRIARGLDREW
jgi:integrase